MMDYQAFRVYRDRIAREKKLLRLDCMNPARALGKMTAPTSGLSEPRAVSAQQLIEDWKKLLLGPDFEGPGKALLSAGIREALEGLFDSLPQGKFQVWMPRDVYPVYWELSEKKGIRAEGFHTYPTLDLTFLTTTSDFSLVLIPSPLSPAGRFLTPSEVSVFRNWLASSRGHFLVLDCAYLFELPLQKNVLELLQGGQVFLLHSMSKTWLKPGCLGWVWAPEGWKGPLRVEGFSPEKEKLSLAAKYLASGRDLPPQIQTIFLQRWERLHPRISVASPDWKPPETGYFSFLQAPFEALLEQDILSVPASVFCSNPPSLSVITCLYYGEEDALP